MARKLTLKKESLTELGGADLALVVGAGTHVTCYTGLTWCPCQQVIDPPPIPSIDTPCNTR